MWNRLRFRNLTGSQKNWAVGGMVLGFGAFVKFGYFYLSREIIIDNLQSRDKAARVYLKESEEWGNWAAEDRKKRAPPLTPEQREQLQNYLAMMANENKDVYPTKVRRNG